MFSLQLADIGQEPEIAVVSARQCQGWMTLYAMDLIAVELLDPWGGNW